LRDFGVKKSLSLLYVDIYQMIIDSLQNISVCALLHDGNMAHPEHGMSAICKNQYSGLSWQTGRLMPFKFPGFFRWHSSPGAQHVIWVMKRIKFHAVFAKIVPSYYLISLSCVFIDIMGLLRLI
jgi:hypothetical protein